MKSKISAIGPKPIYNLALPTNFQPCFVKTAWEGFD
jgi:hypothetical protein